MPPLRVSVVDDEPTIQEMFADALRDAGCAVEATPTMADALDLLTRRRFDAIVADLQLPDIRPFDTIAALRASAPDSRIVVLGVSDRGTTPERARIWRDGRA